MDNFLFQIETTLSGRREHGSTAGATQYPGPRLNSVENYSRAMHDLANAVPPEELSQDACRLYKKLPPPIPEGVTGWGTKGTCALIESGRWRWRADASWPHFENRRIASSGPGGIATLVEHHREHRPIESREITCPINAAGSTGRCNTIQSIDPPVPPRKRRSV